LGGSFGTSAARCFSVAIFFKIFSLAGGKRNFFVASHLIAVENHPTWSAEMTEAGPGSQAGRKRVQILLEDTVLKRNTLAEREPAWAAPARQEKL